MVLDLQFLFKLPIHECKVEIVLILPVESLEGKLLLSEYLLG